MFLYNKARVDVLTNSRISVKKVLGIYLLQDYTKKEFIMAKASARHILVATKEACEALKTKIEAGEDFAACARDNSQCPSGKEGGNLGEFGPGQMVKEFDDVVFSGEVGKVLGPVKTQFGYHLIEVTKRSE
jgi:peptidyl-prolyl cis-trans isomerase C